MKGWAFAALSALLAAGCASKSSDITAAYVSPIMYQNHSCQQLSMEAQGVSARAAALSGAQDQKRTNDAVATGVAIVIFWPAAFLVGGDGPTAAELAQLKGQMTAIEQASIAKNCAISFQRNASADGTPQPTITQFQAPPPVTASKQASGRTKGKQSAPVPPAQATIVVSEPAAPATSETDRMMNSRN
jgi:hypothetical protein